MKTTIIFVGLFLFPLMYINVFPPLFLKFRTLYNLYDYNWIHVRKVPHYICNCENDIFVQKCTKLLYRAIEESRLRLVFSSCLNLYSHFDTMLEKKLTSQFCPWLLEHNQSEYEYYDMTFQLLLYQFQVNRKKTIVSCTNNNNELHNH